MTRIEDHLLEFALREVLRAAKPEPDLSSAVTERVVAMPSPRRGSRHGLLAFATAATAAGIVLTIMSLGGDRALVVDRVVRVALPGSAFHSRSTLPVDGIAWVADGEPATLRGADGFDLELGEGAAVQRHHGSRLRALGGSLRLRTGDTSVVVATGEAELTVAPASDVTLELPPVPDSTEMTMLHEAFVRRFSALSTVAFLGVSAGIADVVAGQERTRVAAGERMSIQDPGAASTEVARARTLLAQVGQEWPRPVDEQTMVAQKELLEGEAELTRLLLRSRVVAHAVADELARALARPEASDAVRGRLIRLAMLCDDQRLVEACKGLLARQPGAFGTEELLALTENGVSAARQRVAAEALANRNTPVFVWAALLAAGEEGARPRLAEALATSMDDAFADIRRFDARSAAAAALAARGDTSAKRALLDELATKIESMLVAETPQKTVQAASFVEHACYFLGPARPRFSHLASRLGEFVEPGLGDGLDAAKVRNVLRRLTSPSPK